MVTTTNLPHRVASRLNAASGALVDLLENPISVHFVVCMVDRVFAAPDHAGAGRMFMSAVKTSEKSQQRPKKTASRRVAVPKRKQDGVCCSED